MYALIQLPFRNLEENLVNDSGQKIKLTQVFQWIEWKWAWSRLKHIKEMHANDVVPVTERISTFWKIFEHFRAFRNHAIRASPTNALNILFTFHAPTAVRRIIRKWFECQHQHTYDSHFEMLKLLDVSLTI